MAIERITDLFISRKLDEAKIEYTPEGSSIHSIKEALKTASKTGSEHVGRPEFVGKSGDFIIVIEDKAEVKNQAKYCKDNNNRLDMSTDAIVAYAENGALHYAKHIVEKTQFKKIFAFGCSGNETHHKIRPIYVDENDYKLLPEVENFTNFNEENINKYYDEIVLNKTPKEIGEIETLRKKSVELNEMLRDYGALSDTQKPLVVSAILLALNENLKLSELVCDDLENDGTKIFNKLRLNLERIHVGKKKNLILHQFSFIMDSTNLNEYNENLGCSPLKEFTNFINEEIFPYISMSHDDILGFFYGEFIKYSTVDGKSLGIVLTPKHITELFCDLLDVKYQDKVLDPCCGTGGFLISAMNRMFEQVETEEERNEIKQNNLHGIELSVNMFPIATTNMILRGDGKSNLVHGDFLSFDPEELQKENFTVGLMNPPYSQRKNKNTAHLAEIQFIKHLLNCMGEEGRCGVIVPQSTMSNKHENKEVKEEILKNHTLEGVITLSADTSFYRIGTHPCIAIFTAHVPHPENKRCKFIDFRDDGYRLAPQIGIVDTPRTIEKKQHLLKCWRDEEDAEDKFMIKTTVKYDDDWLHSYYYINEEIPTEQEFKETIDDYINFEFNMILHDKEHLLYKEG